MPAFAWTDDLLVGCPEIDSQHRYFGALLERLATLADATFGDPEAEELLREIDKYAYFHFSSEEVLMEIYRYPKLDQQKQEHFDLLQVLDKRICDFRRQGTDLHPLMDFLGGWFVGHLKHEDREMAAWIEGRRREVALA